MVTAVIKPAPDRNEYVVWSTYSNEPLAAGDRAAIAAYGQPEARLNLADRTGSSADPGWRLGYDSPDEFPCALTEDPIPRSALYDVSRRLLAEFGGGGMATDDNRMTDEVSAELNPADDPGPAEGQPDPIPPRPADGAAKAKWVDYCVALGADRTFLTADTEHFDAAANDVITEPALTRDELIELADRLGG